MIDPGTLLEGRYRVVRLLGEGAMGAVYEAERTAIGRRVAIKMPHSHFTRRPGAVARFSAEARAAGTIGHPNIVEVLDFGDHQGVPFIVMELLRGETLAERLTREAPLSVNEACALVGRILSALASTHAVGIVHRDLKPENIFLAARGGVVTVKIMDFGVSKFRGADLLDVATQEGTPIGTPMYMSPEQWLGRPDVDHRSDLFSVGVMLYEMITGGLPYEGATQGDLFLEVVRGSSPPPEPSRIEPRVPPLMDPVVLRAVERDRSARFADAQGFLDAIRRFGAADVMVVTDPPARSLMALPPRPAAVRLVEPRTRGGGTLTNEPTPSLVWFAPHLGVAVVIFVAVATVVGAIHLAHRRPGSITTFRAALVAPSHAQPMPLGQGNVLSPTVRIDLQGLPEDAAVAVDGVVGSGHVLTFERGAVVHSVAVTAEGVRHTLVVSSDRDQVIVLASPLSQPDVPVPARHHHHAHAVPGPPGHATMDITREF